MCAIWRRILSPGGSIQPPGLRWMTGADRRTPADVQRRPMDRRMFLIFNQMRPDVFPLDDLGLQRAVFEHRWRRQAAASEARRIRRALAALALGRSWHLWRSLDPLPVGIEPGRFGLWVRIRAIHSENSSVRNNLSLDSNSRLPNSNPRSKSCALSRMARRRHRRRNRAGWKEERQRPGRHSDFRRGRFPGWAPPAAPYTLDYLSLIFTDFRGTARRSRLCRRSCHRRRHGLLQWSAGDGDRPPEGRDTRKIYLFGMPRPEGYRRPLRLMKLAERDSGRC